MRIIYVDVDLCSLLCHIDLAPTLCDLLGIPPGDAWQGESFADAIRGDETGSREYPVLGHGAHAYQRAVRTLRRLADDLARLP